MTQNGDFEVTMPPSDTISALEFSPGPMNLLCAASWDQTVRFWNVEMNGNTVPQSSCSLSAPILDVSWSDNCDRIYLCTAGNEVHEWDLESSQLNLLGTHEAGVRSCHWIHSSMFSCLMTASWDKTMKFWDVRCPEPLLSLNLPDRCYATDVLYPLIAVACANNTISTYNVDNINYDHKCVESKVKQQVRCVNIFHENETPIGFVAGGIEGRAAIHYLADTRDTFTFKCHRSTCPAGYLNIYALNDIKHHPVHNTLVTAGSDGVYMVWDRHVRTKLYTSDVKDQALTKCCFNTDGRIFAYALGYDWTRGHEHFDPNKKPQIFLHPCFEEMKRR